MKLRGAEIPLQCLQMEGVDTILVIPAVQCYLFTMPSIILILDIY